MLYALKILDCLNFIQKRRLIFFCLIKLLFIKVRCLIKIKALRLILKEKGGKQHCLLPFVGSNLGVEIFLKKREHQKRMCWNRGLRHLCILCIFVLIGSLWPKYIMFEIQKYRGLISHYTEELCKFWRKNDLCFEKWQEKFTNFHQSTWKCQNCDFDGILLSKVEKVWP